MARVNVLVIPNSMWITGDCMAPTITPQIINLVLGMRTQGHRSGESPHPAAY